MEKIGMNSKGETKTEKLGLSENGRKSRQRETEIAIKVSPWSVKGRDEIRGKIKGKE